MAKEIHSYNLYADTPVSNADDDIIGRSEVVGTIVRALERITRNEDSSVISLTGPWGSGKTSILNSLDQELKKNDKSEWNIIHHTPWMFSRPETAIRSLYEDLTAALGVVNKVSKAREKAAELFRRVAPFGAAGNFVGVDGEIMMQSAANLIEGDRSANDLLRELGQEFAKTDKYFLVIMDDLDRLEPSELLNTFRTVRLLGRIPRVHYVLSYDEETLTDLLCKTELTPTPSRARDYLEKMTQLRIDVPPLALDLRTKLFKTYFDSIMLERRINLSDEEDIRLHSLWYDVMSLDLDQPRTIKRYLGAVDNLWDGLENGLDFIDYMAMTYLRVQWKSVYDAIYESRYLLLGVQLDFSSSMSASKRLEKWSLKLDSMNLGENTSRILNLTTMIFPALGKAPKRGTVGANAGHGVGDPAYFEQYFQNGKYSNDVSDVAVARDLSLMLSGSSTHLYISDALRRAPEATLKALQSNFGDMPVYPSQRVLDALGSTYDPLVRHAPPEESFIGFEFEQCGLAIIMSLPVDEASAMLRNCLNQNHTKRLALRIFGALQDMNRILGELQASNQRSSADKTSSICNIVRIDFIRACRGFIRDGIGNYPYPVSPRYISPVIWDLHKAMGDDWSPEVIWKECQIVEQFDWLMRMLIPQAFSDGFHASRTETLAKMDNLLGIANVRDLCNSILAMEEDKPIAFPGSNSKSFGWNSRSANNELRVHRNLKKVLGYLPPEGAHS